VREAMHYTRRDDGRALCHLCPHGCVIGEGQAGLCRVRRNRGGMLWATNYGVVSSCGLDPIEKKPLYHFHPGSSILSVGTYGCNLACAFCQNWEISQRGAAEGVEEADGEGLVSPERLVEAARREAAGPRGNIGLAYTYSEPFIWYEYVIEASRLARAAGLKNVLVTNGFVAEGPLRELLPYVNAMNIDVKAFTEDCYRRTCRGALAPVKRTVELARAAGVHVELTNLLIPTLNDSDEEIGALVAWVESVDRAIPLHFSRYFPHHKLDLPPTPPATLRRAREIARARLPYVYLGNVPGGDGS
jgi:pyruvate formate lyase activating enzyme